nr:hypothetical protein [Tanacetum cinerariifolium]
MGSYILKQLKKISFDEIKKLFETTIKIVNTFVPMETEVRGRESELEAGRPVQEQPDEEENELSQEDLQQMMMVAPVEEVYVEALQVKYPITDWERYMHDLLTWRLYDICGVHYVSTEKGMDIFMLVEKEYPLSKGIMTLMLVNKLLMDQHS